mmetsp:Transcript_4083/g.6396  ORF Transcript_4083/g.6396 Transcript_4083/m.6396 type:complete len:565 (-) Transcript_4083:47-1741(-)
MNNRAEVILLDSVDNGDEARKPAAIDLTQDDAVIDVTTQVAVVLHTPTRRTTTNHHDDEEEIQFMGTNNSIDASNIGNDNDIEFAGVSRPLSHAPAVYNSFTTSSFGRKRKRHSNVVARNSSYENSYTGSGLALGGYSSESSHDNVTNLYTPSGLDFGGYGVDLMSNFFGGGAEFISSDDEFADVPQSTGYRSAPKPKARRSEVETTAMDKGKKLQKPRGFDAISLHYPRLKANERTLILYNLLQSTVEYSGLSKKYCNDWRVRYEKNGHPKPELWEFVKSLCDDLLANERTRKKLELSRNLNQKKNDNLNDKDLKPPAAIGPVNSDVLITLQAYFIAYLERVSHKSIMEAIAESSSKEGGLTCSICADEFDPEHTVACNGDDDIHFFCKPCLESYCTVTVQSGPIQSIECPIPNCQSLFATNDIKTTLSSWDRLKIEHREETVNRRVAVAAKAVLHCECGLVAIVAEEDLGDGRVTCPDCTKRYCVKCGNEDHGTDSCPPPAETLQWLDKNSKECPNCKHRIQKNGGCDHMTCSRSAGGCGYEWWWSCGCKYPKHNPDCRRPG